MLKDDFLHAQKMSLKSINISRGSSVLQYHLILNLACLDQLMVSHKLGIERIVGLQVDSVWECSSKIFHGLTEVL